MGCPICWALFCGAFFVSLFYLALRLTRAPSRGYSGRSDDTGHLASKVHQLIDYILFFGGWGVYL